MTMQRKFSFLLNLLIVLPLYPYTTTKDGLTLTLNDYSQRPMAKFFADLADDCQMTMLDINFWNKMYPVRFVITNASTTTYKFAPGQIGAPVRTDYEKINKELPVMIGPSLMLSILAGAIGLGTGIDCCLFAGIHHYSSAKCASTGSSKCDTLRKQGILEHIKHCKDMKLFTKCAAAFGAVGILGLTHVGLKCKGIRSKRFAWLNKHCLPREGIVIQPGEQKEVVVFLTQEAYNYHNFTVSLVEPLYLGSKIESFTVSLLN